MGTIPAPNIAQDAMAIAQAPQNALQEYARTAQLKQQTQDLAQQQQERALQMEAQRRQLADQDALTKTIAQYDPSKYSLGDIPKLVTQNGGSGQAALNAQQGLIAQKQNYLKMTDEQFAQEQKKNDLIQGVHDQVSKAPPEQKQELYSQGLMELARAGVDVSQESPQYPGDEAFAQHLPAIRLHSAVLAESENERKVKAEELKAQYKEVNGALYDVSGPQPKIVQPQGLDPGAWDKFVDQVVPDTKDNHALNLRTHSEVQFAMKRGDQKAAEEAIKAAGQQLGTIEKETNPAVQANKVQTALATGAGMAQVQAAAARGSNAALANVPKELITPATNAADKADTEYAQGKSVSDRLAAVMDSARRGNVVSYQLIPQEGALQLTTSQGVKRINMAEIQNYGGGSLWQRMEGHIGKALTGESIPKSVLDDMEEMQKFMAQGAQEKYQNTLKSINSRYGSTFKPMEMEGLPQGNKSGGAQGGPPAGATHTGIGSVDGKKHWLDAKQNDLGLAE